MILAIQSIKWQQLMSGKGKVPLTAQQIAKAERADRRRVDKEKCRSTKTQVNPSSALKKDQNTTKVTKVSFQGF